MEKLLSTESLLVLAFLLAPGYVFARTKDWITQRAVGEPEESIAAMVYLNLVRSVVLLGVAIVPFGLAQVDGVVQAINKGDPGFMFETWHSAILTTVLLLLLPVGAGVVMGLVELSDVMGKLRRAIGLPPISFEQAWDAAFAAIPEHDPGKIVLIEFTLKKEDKASKQPTVVFGQFDSRSTASRSGAYRDVFCSDEWAVKDHQLVPLHTGGILIRGGEIARLKIWVLPKEDPSSATAGADTTDG